MSQVENMLKHRTCHDLDLYSIIRIYCQSASYRISRRYGLMGSEQTIQDFAVADGRRPANAQCLSLHAMSN